MKGIRYFRAILCFWVFIWGCTSQPDKESLFLLLDKSHTQLNFQNTLEQTTEFNVFDYMYFYNGGGLGIGDFNNDGLPDLYFTANMRPNKMFLHEGNMKFRDVTLQAGVEGTDAWYTGVSVVDINNDGLLDLYVSVVGDYDVLTGVNRLYVCLGIENGIPKYEDQAIDYGLDLVGFGTQAAFVDFDLDGDLDMYQLNHSLHQNGTFGPRESFEGKIHPTAGDKYLRNDNGFFTDVTGSSGIKGSVIGYGLGLSVGDLNFDGWPDIYIGNDFHENDYLYLNQGDGSFKETLTQQIQHTSKFSMGTDIGDINNDGNNEVISLDMLPYDPVILKSSLGDDDFDLNMFKKKFGYGEQFARNNLQLNHGDSSYSEIGMFSGVYATDWSWAPLFLDFDNDGYNDLFISNGIPRRLNDIDYINFQRSSEEEMKKTMEGTLEEGDLSIIEKMPQIKISNKFFMNQRDLTFQDSEERIHSNRISYSNGAHYADLDNDGDLDIVVNNIDDEPFIYKNMTVENGQAGHYLQLDLKGPEKNINAIGARVIVIKEKERIIKEHFPVRGFMSSAQTPMHIGIGDTTGVKAIFVVWPDRTCQKLDASGYNKRIEVQWQSGLPVFDFGQYRIKREDKVSFREIADSLGLNFIHRENTFVEFNREPLIPYMVSAEGPALATGDINGDGLEDVFVGGAKRYRGAFFLQTPTGNFQFHHQEFLRKDSTYEDVDAIFVDIENDGDLDLIVASGGNEFWGESQYLKPRLYVNDGQANFERKETFHEAFLTASCVLPTDFNGDGLIDLFFGARAVPRVFGATPTSYLFQNKGNGEFDNVTDIMLPEGGSIGLVKDGQWIDLDGDGDEDLLLALDWGKIKLLKNEGEKFEDQDLSSDNGWWNFVLAHDFDGDGDLDIIGGNTGMNSRFRPDRNNPVRLYLNDFDDDGQKEQILTYVLGGKEIPFATYAELTGRLVSLKKDYLYANDMARASLPDLFGVRKLEGSLKLEVHNSRSMFFENTGDLKFTEHPLPNELQLSHLECGLVKDFDKDGTPEVLLAGNFFHNNIEMGVYDASYGNILQVNDAGNMLVWGLGGVRIKGQVKNVAGIRVGEQDCIILGKNNRC